MGGGGATDREVATIREVARRWTAAMRDADLEAIGRMVTEDVVIVHGNGRVVTGRRELLADIERSLASLHLEQTTTHEETIVAGGWAFDRARVHSTIRPAAGPAFEVDARTLTLLRRDEGEWRIARSIGVIESGT